MNVLVMGQRSGIGKALEALKIPYLIWNTKKILNPGKAKKIIIAEYPSKKEDLIQHISEEITHVIAGSEDSVYPASNCRKWLNARRNPHNIIIRCTDKLIMKKYLYEKNIPMTEFLGGTDIKDTEKVFEKLGSPLIKKERRSSGGRGLEILTKNEKEKIKNNVKSVLFEKLINGNEGSVESLIINGEIYFSNITEYLKLGHVNLVPGHYSEKIKKEILNLNKLVIEKLKIQWGLTHLEFYLTDEGILFGEIALRPPGGYIMEVMNLAYEENFWDLFVRVELGLEISKKITLKKHSSSIVVHPGGGIFESVEGVDEVMKLKSLNKIKLKLEKGTVIPPRFGVGQDYGYCFMTNKDKEQLLEDSKVFDNILKYNFSPI